MLLDRDWFWEVNLFSQRYHHDKVFSTDQLTKKPLKLFFLCFSWIFFQLIAHFLDWPTPHLTTVFQFGHWSNLNKTNFYFIWLNYCNEQMVDLRWYDCNCFLHDRNKKLTHSLRQRLNFLKCHSMFPNQPQNLRWLKGQSNNFIISHFVELLQLH